MLCLSGIIIIIFITATTSAATTNIKIISLEALDFHTSVLRKNINIGEYPLLQTDIYFAYF
jgi:hypothetical protein